jgi:Protein of unknown function (DUF2924)
MKLNVHKEEAELRRLTMQELRAKFTELFGEATPSANRNGLIKRILWRLQALAEGGLSERARRRAEELANEADLRLSSPGLPRPANAASPNRPTAGADKGPPMPGTVITRLYKGENLQVKVLADGFEFEGKSYTSLSAVAKQITGSHWSGMLFFRLNRKDGGR